MRFSYANAVDSRVLRTVIRLIESVTGIRKIERLLEQRHQYLEAGIDLWSTAMKLLDLRMQLRGFPLEKVPRTGPLIFAANHPFGLADGIAACHLAYQVRTDFRIMAIDLLTQIEEARDWVLPIDFSGTPEATSVNLKSRSESIRHLHEGGSLVLFPAGEVSTAKRVFGQAIESQWATFLGRMISKTRATVVPLAFSGQNTWAFHLASRISETVRLAMLVRETSRMVGNTISVTVGEPLPYGQLESLSDRRDLVDFLRSTTLSLLDGQNNAAQFRRAPDAFCLSAGGI